MSDNPYTYSWGGSPEEDAGIEAEIAAEYRRHEREQRWKALKALWLPPIVDQHATRRRTDGVTCYRDNRGDEWTLWRAVKATVGLVFARYQRDEHDRQFMKLGKRRWPVFGFDMAFWDSSSTYGGHTVDVLQLYPRCRISVFNDGETSM